LDGRERGRKGTRYDDLGLVLATLDRIRSYLDTLLRVHGLMAGGGPTTDARTVNSVCRLGAERGPSCASCSGPAEDDASNVASHRKVLDGGLQKAIPG